MKKFALAAVAALSLAASAEAVTYTYVGSWNVSDGPDWGSEPLSYTGQQAAALLFGGDASDYVTSSVDDQVGDIDFNAWYGVLGASGPNNGAFLFAQDYVSQNSTQAPGYYYSGNPYNFDGTDAASSYVSDNVNGIVTNYAFRVDATTDVPEPAAWMMMVVGFGMLGVAVRRKTTTVRFA